jgi:hypothetical protein
MKIKNLLEGLNSQQRSVPQLPADAQAKHISVLAAKRDPEHPFAGYAVGAAESADAAKKRIGPDRNDPWEQGWRARPEYEFNPYKKGTPEYAQWEDGHAERRAQPRHYDEGVAEGSENFTVTHQNDLSYPGSTQVVVTNKKTGKLIRVIAGHPKKIRELLKREFGIDYNFGQKGVAEGFVNGAVGILSVAKGRWITDGSGENEHRLEFSTFEQANRWLRKNGMNNHPAFKAALIPSSEYNKRKGVAEGLMSKIASKVMGAAPEKPAYKVGQKVKYETNPHQPNWKDGGRGVGVITSYKNGHYMINGNPVNHFEIKGVVKQGVAEGFLNESAYEEAWELISQPVPEIQQFVKQLGLAQDDTTAKQIAPMIDATPDTQLPAASIPKLKNLANKGNDVQTLKAIQQISGRPDAAQQYAKIMQARDAGEGRQRGYDVSGLINSVKSGNYEAPVLLKLATGTYVIGGRTRLYAALALGIPAKVKIISVSTFAKQGQQGVAEGRAGVDDTDTVGFSVNSEAAYMAVMDRYGDSIDHDETSGIMYVPAKMWPNIEMVAFDADGEGATQDDGYEHPDSPEYEVAEGRAGVDDDIPDLEKLGEPVQSIMDAERRMAAGDRIFVAHEMDDEPFEIFNVGDLKGYTYDQVLVVPQGVTEGERNEMDTPAVQAALKKMAERHKGEKWTKDQLAALGKRIAARGQKNKNVRETNFAQAGEVVGGIAGGIGGLALSKGKKSGYVAGTVAGSAAGNAAGRWIDRKLEPKIGRDEVGATKAVTRYQKPAVAKGDMDEGWKQTVAGAALAGAAALGGGGASAADVNDPSWSKAGYDSHIKADSSLTKTTSSDGVSAPKVSKDHQRRISDVVGPNAQGEYRVTVSQNGKIASQYVTKTPPPGWLVKESAVTKEDIITKLKARLGDYLSDISKEIKKDPDLVDKLAAKSPGDQMGPPVKTVTTDDGHEIQIHGNEDDGFRISIKNKQAPSRFNNLDEAVMACEMYCARRRKQALNADYVEEA